MTSKTSMSQRARELARNAKRRGLVRSRRRRLPSHLRRRLVWVLRGILCAVLAAAVYVGVTIYPYLTAPGTDRVAARVAEWGRDHHLSWAVTWLENQTYTAPPAGGALSAEQRRALLGGQGSAPHPHPTAAGAAPVDLPANIPAQASRPLPGEGVWHPVIYGPAGNPVLEQAALRPDDVHTSKLAYAVWMNQKALAFTLHPGYQQPGGSWPVPDSLSGAALKGLVATWNGGFKVHPDDALGGYYDNGVTAVPLVAGKASEVFHRDGSLSIGAWGTDVRMGPGVLGVRQNLSLLVDHGEIQATLGAGSGTQWGYTINNDFYIARSGVGITATGDIVYVSGSALSVSTLAHLLKAAGAVNAMELDINPDWVSFMTYSRDPVNPDPVKLWDFVQPAGRYLQPSSRDFVSVNLR
ncbi:phosphodiester glycosidase family protein [Actinospica sp. MGRD01-02]|uniref:Phosphodiester glycosidase family protein n=1 Tax=Actinospica acidithermotolerans TaxID=2828514 RepID=A0A941EKH1_9ACTN|nr:phosphodiester glycosidase family protein [Actinospica acidithermotolerans]MBR7830754.1 phosphodiester glycosidase family protein [Actinospica acidithermotolerans]